MRGNDVKRLQRSGYSRKSGRGKDGVSVTAGSVILNSFSFLFFFLRPEANAVKC